MGAGQRAAISFSIVCACVIGASRPAPVAAQVSKGATSKADTPAPPARLGIGHAASPAEIAAWDIDVRPDGLGLPAGSGTAAQGAPIYAARCAVCHGKTGKEGPEDVLVGREPRDGFPFGRDPSLEKTIGNYWPYATTIYDYVRRAMPANAPGSLQDDDVYNVVAYLLFLNDVIPADAVIDRTSLPMIRMPWRMEATADLRNLLAPGYLPLGGAGARSVLTNSPRLVRGGLNFIF